MTRLIKLSNSSQAQGVRIYSRAVRDATDHVRLILSGVNLYTGCGTKITLKMASERRKRCIKLVNLALKGFVR